jgi:hypothetical protein
MQMPVQRNGDILGPAARFRTNSREPGVLVLIFQQTFMGTRLHDGYLALRIRQCFVSAAIQAR